MGVVRGVEWFARANTNMAVIALMPELFPHLFPHGDSVKKVFLAPSFRQQKGAVRKSWKVP